MEEKEKLKNYWLLQRELIDYLLSRIDEQPLDNIRLPDTPLDFWVHPWIMAEELSRINQHLRELKSQTISQCAFNNVSGGNSIEFLVAPSKRKEGLREIRDFTRDAESLIVIDPYIYGGESSQAAQYVQEFKNAARLHHLKFLHVIFDSKSGNTTAIKKEFEKVAKSVGCRFSDKDTDKIHDRIWIKNKQEAIIVGTSLGGLGNRRLSFILELPSYDLEALLEYLHEETLLF